MAAHTRKAPDAKAAKTEREAALRVLTACRRDGAWADAALRAQLGRASFSPAGAALCSRIVYGVLQNRMLLDYDLAAFCTQRPERLQPPLPDILRMGAYQILFLDRVPDHAAVHEAVELTRLAGRGQASGLVNAVLRSLIRRKDALPPLPEGDLALRYSHPRWIVDRVVSLLGAEEAEGFLAANNRIPPVSVRVNPLRTTEEALSAQLAEEGVGAVPHSWIAGCLELSGAGDVASLPAFQAGACFVQDPAAQLAVRFAGIQPGERVLDVCAAPGGKSFSAAIAAGERGSVLSCDVHPGKLRQVREGAARLGLGDRIRTEAADGRVFRPEWEARFDTVLADVPCSGLGVIRKKPDIRYKAEETLRDLPAIQLAILENAARYVRPGGTLVYSTCTILPEENENVTDAFLASCPAFAPAPPEDAGPPEGWSLSERQSLAKGRITLWPQRRGTDGFYICVLRKMPYD